MKNSKNNNDKKQKNYRDKSYKAISLASLSTIALTLGLSNFKEVKSLMTKGGTIRWFGSSVQKVIQPGNMGSTGNTGAKVVAAKSGAVANATTKVTGGINTTSRGFAKFNKQWPNPFTKIHLDSLKNPSIGSTSSVKKPTSGTTSSSTKNNSNSSTGATGSLKLPATNGSTSGSLKLPNNNTTETPNSGNTTLVKRPSSSSTSSNTSSNGAVKLPIGEYEDVTQNQNTNNPNTGMSTAKKVESV
ncbi:hypothetical protein SFB3_356G1 [Candidatus Arthromitus sp. SFB-3]|nr:hypothetical protein SFB3_356G1 [Candidatus Arthromitus sp. SFB-3]